MSILVTWRAGEEGGMSWSRSFPDAADALSVKVSTDPRISCCLQSPPFRQLFSLSRWWSVRAVARWRTRDSCNHRPYLHAQIVLYGPFRNYVREKYARKVSGHSYFRFRYWLKQRYASCIDCRGLLFVLGIYGTVNVNEVTSI